MAQHILWAPTHLDWNLSERRSQRFTETQTFAFNAAYNQHQVNGQLPRAVKVQLVEYTGLTMAQVNRWVENKYRSLVFTDGDIALLNDTLLLHGTSPPKEVMSHLMKKARKTERQIRDWLDMTHHFNVVGSSFAS